MQFGSMFISNCNNALQVSDAFCDGFRTSALSLSAEVRKPSTFDALIGYFTPSHVIHQRLLLQFLSAPEDGRKKRPKHVEHYCSY